ncbi:MAG: aminodeoxychorismate/anthranilate synthase component II, partial [Lachnospiraceae bacterium]|nr:aminodeoxychorismate/anthranilate synthase component II [Lachnospiraceae bacterium]
MIGAVDPEISVIRNDAMSVEQIDALTPGGIVLSPGPGRPEDAGVCIDVVKELGSRYPILGVCLGHQSICTAYGGLVGYARELMHGKQSECSIDLSCRLFEGLEETEMVGRYHSLAADEGTLPACLKVTARTADGEIMAVRHLENEVYGIQFHPESILTPHGNRILENFVKISRS